MSKLENLKNNKFIVSFSTLASGSIIAQLLSILISPITTRLYTPEEFGFYTLIFTAVGMFGPVICLKYDMNILTIKDKKEVLSIIQLSFLLCLILSLLISIGYSYLFFSNDRSTSSTVSITISIFVLLFLYGINNVLLSYNNKYSLYKLISKVTVIRSMTSNGVLVILGIFNLGASGLVGAQILGAMIGIKSQSKDLRKNNLLFNRINFKSIKNVLIEYKNQPLYNATSALISTSIYSSINVIIKLLYSVEQLGLYSLSYRVLGIPFSIISANVARVYFQSAVTEMKVTGNYKKTFIKTITLLTLIVVPFIFLLAITAPWIFYNLFGAEWEDAGLFVRLLAPMFAIRLITESLTTGFIVSNKQRVELIFQSILLFGQLFVYLISYYFHVSIELFLIQVSVLYVLVYSAMIFVMYKNSTSQ